MLDAACDDAPRSSVRPQLRQLTANLRGGGLPGLIPSKRRLPPPHKLHGGGAEAPLPRLRERAEVDPVVAVEEKKIASVNLRSEAEILAILLPPCRSAQ